MRTVVIIGGNRGIGLGWVKHYLDAGCRVITTCRAYDGANDARELKQLEIGYPGLLTVHKNTDITDKDAVKVFTDSIEHVDLLILSAGIKGYLVPGTRPTENTSDEMLEAFKVNCVAHDNIVRSLFHKLLHPNAAVVLMSSGVGSIQDNTGGAYEPYRVAKAAADQMILTWFIELIEQWDGDLTELPVAFALCAGWVRTDMGGANARLSVERSVELMAAVIEKTIITKRGNGLLMYDGSYLEKYAVNEKLKAAILATAQHIQASRPQRFGLWNTQILDQEEEITQLGFRERRLSLG